MADERNILERSGDDIMQYMRDDNTNFAPAAIGALLGGGASALYTERRKGESTKQRALRTIRNALVGGALGGTGAQLGHYAIETAGSAIDGRGRYDEAKAKDEGTEKPPLGSGLAPRTAVGGGIAMLLRRIKAMTDVKNYTSLLPEPHVNNAAGVPNGPFKGVNIPTGKMIPGVAPTTPIWGIPPRTPPPTPEMRPVTMKDVGTIKENFLNKGKAMRQGMNSLWGKLRRKTVSGLPNSGIPGNPADASMRKAVAEDFIRQRPDLIDHYGGQQSVAQKKLEQYLATKGVGTSAPRRALNTLVDLFNPAAGSLKMRKRVAGRVVGPTAIAAAFLTPDILHDFTSGIGRGTDANGTLAPKLPDAGATTESRSPLMDALFGPRDPIGAASEFADKHNPF